MVKKFMPFFIFCSSILVIIGILNAQEGNTDFNDLAKRLVSQSANVQEGEHVLIYGSVRDMALMEEIALEVRKTGAFPLIQVGSEPLSWRMFSETPKKYDSQPRTLGLKIS